MKKKYSLITSSLLVSLFIYLFYRTEKTLINKLLISVISLENFIELKKSVINTFPLNAYIIYSLPEGLWVFSITLASRKFFIQVFNYKISLLYIPLIFSIGLEFFQLFHITNGTFDFWDIGVSVFFWILANYLSTEKSVQQNIFKPLKLDNSFCVFSYLIVYLAHVLK